MTSLTHFSPPHLKPLQKSTLLSEIITAKCQQFAKQLITRQV
jgi:hypothetical protein